MIPVSHNFVALDIKKFIRNRLLVNVKPQNAPNKYLIVGFAFLFTLVSLICSTQMPVSGNPVENRLGLYPLLNNLEEPGCLDIYKYVNWSPKYNDPDYIFQICIQGRSYPNWNCQYFASTQDPPWSWYGLMPGDYYVSEPNPQNLWEVTISPNPVWVPALTPEEFCSSTQVNNIYNRGILWISKDVVWNGVDPYDKTFWICIQGPSFPTGNENGACQPTKGGLINWEVLPGNYAVQEIDSGTDWEVSIPPGSTFVDKGESVLGPTITNTHKKPGFQLLTPNGNEVLAAGQPWMIRWNTVGALPNVRLEYSTDDFMSGIIIADTTPNSGSYLWTLPPDPKNNLRVRVSVPGNLELSDTSDQPFRSVIMNERNYLTEISR